MKKTLECAYLIILLMPGLWGQDVLERGKPRIYTGENLEAVAMPIGGIGTGTLWIDGKGSLPVWQIFNNLTEEAYVPESFFAVRAKAQGEEPVLCALEGIEHKGFKPMRVLSFQGDYPFAWLKMHHDALPIEVFMEAFNPMIPLNLKDSSLPCAIFRLTARNPGEKPTEVSFAAMLQNAVGYDGYSKIVGRYFWGFGDNQNRLTRGEGYAHYTLDIPYRLGTELADPIRLLYSGPMSRQLDTCVNLELLQLSSQGPPPSADAAWIEGLGDQTHFRLVNALVRVADEGGVILLSGTQENFFQRIEEIKAGQSPEYIVFEDFESQDYEGWTQEGEAFGNQPSNGTFPEQNPVSGFIGEGLVNTYFPDDLPQGTLTSKPFSIEHDYIGFLVGGGAHEDRTCIHLKVNGKVVRSAAGKRDEYLEPAQWDVQDLKGNQGVIEILDKESGGWGHINLDQIVFSNTPPLTFLQGEEAWRTLAQAIPFQFEGEKTDFITAGWEVDAWRFYHVENSEELEKRPALVKGPFGKGTIFLYLGPKINVSHGLGLVAKACGTYLNQAGRGLPEYAPAFGDMGLTVRDSKATATAYWTDSEALAADLLDDGSLSGPENIRKAKTVEGETKSCALAVPFSLNPGEERSVDFIITWRFPNLERYGHQGNLYAKDFSTASEVASYVVQNFQRLRDTTLLYHDTLYETNLPYWMVDCLSSQSCIFRTVLCFYAQNHGSTELPYFAGYEGCYGCCPLNCTHVWNYAQTHARLYPEIGRNLRWYDFMHYLKEDGETQHRQHRPHGAFIDGHCAVILGAYREYLMSPDGAFLREIWPNIKKAVEWLISKIDPDEDGVNEGHQWNTYDVATSGAHTFIGSQYLSALAAAEKMALVMEDSEAANRWGGIRKAGSENQDRLLWKGEYYIQIPDEEPARDYNTGCHSDQLLGQWWAHMLDNGYLYPVEHVRSALKSIMKYNFMEEFRGFKQQPRRYVIDEDGGLLICTWPKDGRPTPFILYADEVWTGIEYATAALMVYEGLLEEAFQIVKTARERYDGVLRHDLNSGPGGNPFNELECGRFYARALSSWSLLLACQGFIYEGPKARIGFLPPWKPEDHKSFFTAAEGWGLFTQKKEAGVLTAVLELRYGRLPVKEVVLGLFKEGIQEKPAVEGYLGDKSFEISEVNIEGDRICLSFEKEQVLSAGDVLKILMK